MAVADSDACWVLMPTSKESDSRAPTTGDIGPKESEGSSTVTTIAVLVLIVGMVGIGFCVVRLQKMREQQELLLQILTQV
jgi:uncharacterized protein HemX